jgi:hypothetical protein
MRVSPISLPLADSCPPWQFIEFKQIAYVIS